MKLHALILAALLATSGAASAEFFDGFDNGAATGNAASNGTGSSAADATGYGQGNGDVNGFGRAQGSAEREVNFNLTFKGKGRTNLDSDMAVKGQGNGDWYAAGNGYGQNERSFAGNATSSTASEAPMTAVPATPPTIAQ